MYKSVLIFILFLTAIAKEPVNGSELTRDSLNSTFTLDEAFSFAMENSPVLKVNKMRLKEASIKVEESRLQYIPDIYLSGDLRRNLIIPATPVPANVFDSSAGEGELMYLKFNTKWNSTVGINLKYDLFNPANKNRVAEQNYNLRIQEYDTEISEADLKEQIAIAYSECVIAEEQKQLFQEDTFYFQVLLNEANQQFLKEKINLSEKNDINRAYNESLSAYHEAQKIATDRKAELLYLIGMDITAENIEMLSLQEDIPTLLNKIEYKAIPLKPLTDLEIMRQQEVTELASLRVKSAQWKFAPTLSLNGYYGTNYYNNEFSLFNNNFWRGNSYIGLSLMIPVTQSLSTTNEVSRLRLQHLMETENLRDIRNLQEKDRLNKLSQLQVRRENYRLANENLEMSRDNLKAFQMQFEKGYIKQSDLLNEHQKIRQYRHNFLQAANDLFKSLITLD